MGSEMLAPSIKPYLFRFTGTFFVAETRRDLTNQTNTPHPFSTMSNIFEAGSTEERGENARLR